MKSRPHSSAQTETASAGMPESRRQRRRLNRSGPAPLALEQRIMFDGAAADAALAAHRAIEPVKEAPAAATAAATAAAERAASPAADRAVPAASAAAMDNAEARHEIVFIEDNVANFQQLAAGVRSGVEVVVLDHTRDGLRQMADALKDHAPVDAIHLFTHGANGEINLGATSLNSASLDQHRDQLAAIGKAMSGQGDLLIYGCDVAQDGMGRAFVDRLADATGADVAASSDATGAAVLGGNWDLEYAHGRIDAQVLRETQYEGLMVNAVTSINAIAGDGVVNASEKTSVIVSGALNNSSGAVRVTVTDGTHSVSTTAAVSGGSTFSTAGLDLSSLNEGSLTVYAKQYNNTTNADNAGNLTAGDVSAAISKDSIAPAFSTASVNGAQLVMTYADTGTLDAVNLPPASAFSVKANGADIAVSGVAVSATGKTVTLTLASAVTNGQAVTVAYADPTAGNDVAAIQDAAGNDAATLAATSVANNTSGVVNAAPTLALSKPTVSYNGASISLGTPGATEIADSDSTAFANLKVSFTPGADAASETLGGIALNKTSGAGTITLNGVNYNYSVSASGATTFTFTRAAGNFSAAEVEALLDQLRYGTSKSMPTAGNRVFNISVTDSGSATSSVAAKTITVASSAIDLASSSGWTAILRGANYDYNDDTQANASKGLDLVGDANNPLLYSQYNALTGELAFRIREETSSATGVFYLLGIIGTPSSSKIDFFIGVNIPSGNGARTVMFYDPGADANISPSTSSFNTKTAVAPSSYAIAITSTGSDLDANGATDGFINFKFSAADLTAYANSRVAGGYSIDKSVAFVLLTATQNNSINGDIGGIRGTSSQTYADLGIATPVVFSNTPPTGAADAATIAEDNRYVFNTANDFPFSDTDASDTLAGVRITALPGAGTLQYDTTGSGNWTAVALNQTISASDINAGRLRFVPGVDGNGAPYASFSFQVSDGKTLSADSYAFTLNVTAINDAPVISRLAGDIAYWTASNTPVPIDALPAAVVSDVDSADFNGGALTLQVSGGNAADNALSLASGGAVSVNGANVLVNGQLVGQLSGAGTGTLTLSFQSAYATPAAVSQVLAAVRYTYSGNETTPALRTLSASVTDGDGGTSNAATVTLVGPPVYNAQGTEDLPLAFAAADYLIGTSYPGSVRLTELVLGGGTLTFTRNGGTITLTGATDLNSLAALTAAEFNTLVYHPAADAYGDGLARLRFKYADAGAAGNGQYDAQGLSLLNPTVIINLAAVNDAPVVDLNGAAAAGTGYAATWTEIDGPDESWNDVALVAPGTVNLSDVDSTLFYSLTVAGAVSAGDQIVIGGTAIDLAAGGSGTVTVSGTAFGYTASVAGGNAVLTLSSQANGAATPASVASYEALIDALRYNNASDTPAAGSRSFGIRVNDGQADSAVATATVTVVAVNDTPTLGGVAQTAQYDYGRDTPVAIFPSLTLADRDDRIKSVTLTINNPVAGDTLSFAGSANIAAATASYSGGASLILTLTGTGGWTTAELQSAVRAVTFSNASTASAGADRLIDVQATDDGAIAPVKTSSVGTIRVSLVNGTPGIDLVSAADSGISSTDNVTQVATPTFSIAVPSIASSGQVVSLYDGQSTDSLPYGNLVASATLTQNGAQTVNLTVGSALPDGLYTFYTSIDNGQTAQLDVVIDRTSPSVAITGITDDTGTAGDFITRDAQLVFSGTAEAGSSVTVTLTDAGSQQMFQATVAADDNTGAWSVDRGAFAGLADGSYTLAATAKDIAGNAATATRTIRVDTGATITIGTIAGDDRINAAEDDTAVILSGGTTGVESGQTVAISLGGKTYTATVAGDGAWSASMPASDAQALSASNTVSVSVTDVAGNVATGSRLVSHDGVAPAIGANQAFNHAENRADGAAVGVVSAGDNLGVTGFRFLYADGVATAAVSEDGYYSIGADGTIRLTTAGAAANVASNDFETAPNSISYRVQAGDLAGNWSAAQSIRIAVTNIDEVAPAFGSGASAMAMENQALLYTASATDTVDYTDQIVSYGLKANNGDDAGLLAIDAVTGKVTLAAGVLDYEGGKTGYTFTVVARDASNNAREQTVTVTVGNVDEVAPAFTSGASGNAAENQNLLYTATATDLLDATDHIVSYRLKTGGQDDANLLAIDAATGKVTLAAGNLDYEGGKTSYAFTVVASDASGNSREQAVTVAVTNVDEVAPAFSSATAASAANGQNLLYAAAAADDIDFTDKAVAFSLKAGNNDDAALLAIDAATGKVTLASGNLDHAAKSRYVFTVIARDQTQNIAEQAVTITVTDPGPANLPPVSVTLDHAVSTLAENAAVGGGIKLGDIVVGDDGAGVNTLSLSGADAASFAIRNGNELVYIGGAFDFETKARYDVTIAVDDTAVGGTPDAAQAFTLNITNVDEVAPAITSAASASVPENTSLLYTAAATDNVDFTDKIVTYGLKANNNDDAGLLAIDAATGKVTLASGHPDYESGKTGYAFTVVATDASGNASERSVTLAITNVDELAPAFTTEASGNALENQNLLYTAGATDDVDFTDKAVTYSLKANNNDDAGLLAIDTATGKVTLATGNLDYESGKTNYAFTVIASDGSGNASERAVEVNVLNVDEVAPALTSAAHGSAAENQNLLYTASATDDVDFTDKAVTFSLKANNNDDAGLLAIDAATGKVTLASGNLDYESGKTGYAFTVVAADASGNTREKAVTVSVANIDEQAPQWTSPANSLAPENQAVLVTVAASDLVDFTDQMVSYRLQSGNQDDAALLVIDPASGEVRLADGNADHEGGKTAYTFTAIASDASGNARQRQFTVSITDVNDRPVGADAAASTVQNKPLQGRLPAAVDQDGDTPVYAVDGGPAHGTLTLAPDGGYAYVPANDYAGSDSFTYRVSDGKGGSNVYTVTIRVAPNAAPVAADDAVTTREDTAVRAQLPAATDADNDALVYAGAEGPAHGTVVIAADGSYTYRPDADFNGTDAFTYRVTDANGAGTTHIVRVNVTPVNDPAQFAGSFEGAVTEDSVLTATGALRVTDVDAGEASVLAGSSRGVYGGFRIDAAGKWTYTLDNGSAKVQALVAGQTVTETFVVRSADGTASAVTIAIHGADKPAVSTANPGAFVGPERPVSEPAAASVASTPAMPAALSVPAFVGPDPRDARPVAVSFQDARSSTATAIAAPGSVVGNDASRAALGLGRAAFDLPAEQAIRNGAALSDVYTRSEGFRTVVARADEPALVLFRGVPDQYTESGTHLSLTVPADAFAHTQPKEVVRLSAMLQDGRPLPSWAQFNAQTGQFTGEVPPGLRGELRIKVVARDMQGREATALFRVNIGMAAPGDAVKNSGKAGLSEQLRQSALGGRRIEKLSTNGRTLPTRGSRLG